MNNQDTEFSFSTYHKMFIGLLLLGFIISSSVLLRQYGRDQVVISTSYVKKCAFMQNEEGSYVNIVSSIGGSKKANLMLLKLEPLEYKDLELVESYFYRGRKNDIPTFGIIPENIKRRFQKINGAQLTANTVNESDNVVWIFRVTGPNPDYPHDRRCEIKWLGLSISKISKRAIR